MDEVQRVIDRILAILADVIDPAEDEVRTLNETLVAAVEKANDRLRTCERLLRKGLRSEAIQECETDPNLLDVVAVLDFAEWNEWADAVREQQYNPPVDLHLETAADLNEAYALDQPLERLLKRHRLLALTRAPLSERITVLRRIRSSDADNPIWDEDVRSFERERLSGIAAELRTVAKSGDLDAVTRLESELKSSDWTVRPSKALRSRVVRLHTDLRSAAAHREMEEVEQGLRTAFEELDVETARHWRDRWDALNRLVELSDDSELARLAAPALGWVRDQDEEDAANRDYEQAVAELEQALEDHAPRDVLLRLQHAATRADRDLPGPLGRRLIDEMEYLQSRSHRKHVVLLVASLAALLLVSVLVGFVIVRHNHAEQIATDVANIASLLKEGKLAEARHYCDGLADVAWLIDSPEIRKAIEDLGAAETQAGNRKTRLSQLLQSARSIGLGRPDWQDVEVANKNIARAKALAKTAAELTLVEQARTAVWQQRKQLQTAVDEQFAKDVKAFRQRLKRVAVDDVTGWGALLAEVQELKRRPRVSDIRKAPLPGLEAAIRTSQNTASRNVALTNALSNITRQIGHSAEFVRALNTYVQKDPKSVRAADFKNVVTHDVALWTGMTSWNDLQGQWPRIRFRKLDSKYALRQLQRLKTAAIAAGAVRMPPELSALQPGLEAVAHRDNGKADSLLGKLRKLLDDPLIAGISMVYTQDKGKIQRWYVNGTPRSLGKKWTFKKYTGLDVKATESGSVRDSNLGNLRNKTGITWLSPQSRFADYAKKRLQLLSRDGWEPVCLDLLDNLSSNRTMDPIIKAFLMQQILDAACDGSVAMQAVFAADRKRLDTYTIDPAANWFDPKNTRAAAVRKVAQKLLKEITSPKTRKQQMDAAQDAQDVLASHAPGPRYRWIGWLSRDVDGKFLLRFPGRLPVMHSGSLRVVFLPTGQRMAKLQTVGKIVDGKISITRTAADPAAVEAYVEGRPIFYANQTNRKIAQQTAKSVR